MFLVVLVISVLLVISVMLVFFHVQFMRCMWQVKCSNFIVANCLLATWKASCRDLQIILVHSVTLRLNKG